MGRDGAGLLRADGRAAARGSSCLVHDVTYANLSGCSCELKGFLYDYLHRAWWAHAEGLPQATNTVTLDPR